MHRDYIYHIRETVSLTMERAAGDPPTGIHGDDAFSGKLECSVDPILRACVLLRFSSAVIGASPDLASIFFSLLKATE